jgi:hypothetical protein
MPSGITSGDLLLVYVVYAVGAERVFVTPSGWTRIGRTFGNSAVESYVYARVATGGDTLTLTKTREAGGTGGAAGVAIAYRISGQASGVAGDIVGCSFANSFANPTNPPSHTAVWGSADNLWLAGNAISESNFPINAYPSSYTLGQLTVAEVGVTYRAAMAGRQLAAATEDPDVFVFGATPTTPSFGQLVTIAVRGTSAAVADLTGNVTLDNVDPTGTLGLNPSSLTGSITLDAIAPTGTLGIAPGQVTTLPFVRNSGSRPLGLTAIAVAILSDDANMTRLAGATSLSLDGSGRLTYTGAGLPSVGTSVLVVTRESDGRLGLERYTVA